MTPNILNSERGVGNSWIDPLIFGEASRSFVSYETPAA